MNACSRLLRAPRTLSLLCVVVAACGSSGADGTSDLKGWWLQTDGREGGAPVTILGFVSAPQWYLLELGATGPVRGQMVTRQEAFGITASPQAFWRASVAVGKDGTIAATPNGEHIFARDPDDPPPAMMPFQITISGTGRVYSDDGRVDCRQSCTVQLPFGERLPLRAEPIDKLVIFPRGCHPGFYALYGWCWGTANGSPQAFTFGP